MDAVLRYRGREIRAHDVATIIALLKAHPNISRRALSLKVCAEWGWVQDNGAPRDAVCRGLLLALHRAGRIELPAPRYSCIGAAPRRPPPQVALDTTPLWTSLSELGELSISEVRRTADEPLVDGMLAAHHYLGRPRPVGEHLKLLVRAGERPVACFVWTSAPRHLGPRDRHIGWSAATRRERIRLVAYNTRFLILPWVRVPHLASHLLARMTRSLPALWESSYGHPVWFAETFVDTTRYRGTCYRAANWLWLGVTTGRGKDDQTRRANRSLKDVWGLGLCRRYRERLCGGSR
jgi:hypothetical protein